MPFYEYQCSACGHHHEELQKISDGPLRKCPACGRSTLKRLMSAPAFRLKGGGTGRNVVAYEEKVKPLQDKAALHERNVEALKKEIGNLR